jgi:hypothetical protein
MKITVFDQPLLDILKANGSLLFEYPNAKIWNQKGISLARRVSEDPGLQQKVTDVLTAENLKKYIVAADSEAPTRCIDGRVIENWHDDPKLQSRTLGPKVAGGTAHAALAHRIVDVDHIRKDLLYEEDIRFVIKRYKHIGVGVGGHIDGHARGWNTGCGAVDNINLILDKLQRPEHQEQLRGLARIIIGDAYSVPIVNEIIGRMLHLDALKPIYLPRENNDPDGEFMYKKTIVDVIRRDAAKSDEPVPSLSGSHNEVAVILNFVPQTTFDSDRFGYDNDNDLQAFGWDIWEMYQEAERLYPYRMNASIDTQRSAIENRVKYITTRTFLGIATTMVLTDGTMRVVAVNK